MLPLPMRHAFADLPIRQATRFLLISDGGSRASDSRARRAATDVNRFVFGTRLRVEEAPLETGDVRLEAVLSRHGARPLVGLGVRQSGLYARGALRRADSRSRAVPRARSRAIRGLRARTARSGPIGRRARRRFWIGGAPRAAARAAPRGPRSRSCRRLFSTNIATHASPSRSVVGSDMIPPNMEFSSDQSRPALTTRRATRPRRA